MGKDIGKVADIFDKVAEDYLENIQNNEDD